MTRKFTFFIPGHMHTREFYGKDEQDARRSAREWLGVKRLPNDTYVEPCDYKSAEFIRKNNEELVRGTGLATTDLY